ncbi:MAG: Crp/Fnr family transcriptional regulator [Ruminococcaceae bacterium]|nr:Crp/Fnr family transcriptional regulator [Oscillospiraceae bacterium]
MEKNKSIALQKIPLLAGCGQETLKEAETLPVLMPGRGCYRPNAGELVILLWGKARVNRREGDKTVLLNRLEAGNCFGYAGLYSDSLPDTEIVFSAQTAILVIPRETVERFIMQDPVFARNIIAVLSKKVRFLNSKIAGYTAKDSGEKLYRHLLNLPRDRDGYVIPGESMASLSRRLDMSRASLYRAVDALMAEGKLEKIGQKYKITVREN